MHVRAFLSVIGLTLFFGTGPAAAAGGCYSDFELEAEQGLRIHSELMVIGLTCQKAPGGSGLYGKYRTFTRKNQYLLEEYETSLMNHYRNSGQNPSRALHNLRTGLANEISEKAIMMNVSTFCRHYGGRVEKALNMNHDTIRRWARKEWPSQPPTKPLCQNL
ncbi:MAG: hypothetical protein ACQEQL_04665 [Pseudomonadota bacterium]